MKELKRYLPLQISTLVLDILKFEKCVKSLTWSQRLSFNIIFFYLEISDAKRRLKKRKPLVIENLTFMLARHLRAVKHVIFF